MSEVERRTWTAPDGGRFTIIVADRSIVAGKALRRVRRAEFVDSSGQTFGDVAVPSYFSLALADSYEIEQLWRWLAG